MFDRSLRVVLFAFMAISALPSKAQTALDIKGGTALNTVATTVSPNNAKLRGALLDGSPGDIANLQRIYDSTPSGGTIDVPGGKWPVDSRGWAVPLVKTVPGKRVFWNFLGPVDAGLDAAPGTNPVASVGDGDVTQSFAHGNLTLARRLLTGKDEASPGIEIDLENHNSAFRPYAYGSGPNIPALMINASSFPGSTGQLNGLWINLNSGGNNPYSSEEQGLNVIVNKTGQNSTWQISGLTLDTTGTPPKSFASVAQEMDIIANGPDDPASLYDGHKGERVFAYYLARPYPFPAYAANKVYPPGAKVVVTSPGGVKAVYVTPNGGTSGATGPNWSERSRITDNTVTWVYGEPYNITIGRGIWFDGDKDGPEPPRVRYSTLFSSNALVDNAAMDLSETSLANPNSAAIRLARNEPIDFSGNGTAAAQNMHIIQYSDRAAALTYTVKGTVALAIADTGLASFPGQIQAPLATPKSSSSPCVTGTRTADTNYEYVCVATNTWKRAVLSPF